MARRDVPDVGRGMAETDDRLLLALIAAGSVGVDDCGIVPGIVR